MDRTLWDRMRGCLDYWSSRRGPTKRQAFFFPLKILGVQWRHFLHTVVDVFVIQFPRSEFIFRAVPKCSRMPKKVVLLDMTQVG